MIDVNKVPVPPRPWWFPRSLYALAFSRGYQFGIQVGQAQRRVGSR